MHTNNQSQYYQYSTPPSPLYPPFLQHNKYNYPLKSLHHYVTNSKQQQKKDQQIGQYSKKTQVGRLDNHLFYSFDYVGQQLNPVSRIVSGQNKFTYLTPKTITKTTLVFNSSSVSKERIIQRLSMFKEVSSQRTQLQKLDFKTLHEIDQLNDRDYKMVHRKPLKMMFRCGKDSNRLQTQGRRPRVRSYNFQQEQMPRPNKFAHISRHQDFQRYIDYLQRSISPIIKTSFIDRSRVITQPKDPFRTPKQVKSSASEAVQEHKPRRSEKDWRVIKVLRMVKNRGQSLVSKLTKYPSLKIVKKE